MKNKIYYGFLIGFTSLLVGSVAINDGLLLRNNVSNIEINDNSGDSNNDNSGIWGGPAINYFNVADVTNTSATFNWSIDDNHYFDTNLSYYLIDENTGKEFKVLPWEIEHPEAGPTYFGSHTINGLDSNQDYEFALKIHWDEFSTYKEGEITTVPEDEFVENVSKGVNVTFTTLRSQYDAPTFESFSVDENSIDLTSATINWSINDPNNLIDEFKLVINGETIDLTNYKNDGSYDIKNLKPNETYTLNLEANWSDKEYVYNSGKIISDTIEFTTLDSTWQEPVILNFSINESTMTDTTVPITWKILDINETITNIKIVNGKGDEIENLGTSSSGTQTIDDLVTNTTYRWRLVVEWENTEHGTNGVVKSDLMTFTTLDQYSIPKLKNFEIFDITDSSAKIKWEYDLHSISNLILLVDGQPKMRLDTSWIGEATIDGLNPNTTYSLSLKAEYNIGGEYYFIESESYEFTTNSFKRVKIDEFNITAINRTSVQVDWAITDPNKIIENIKIVDESGNTIQNLGNNLEGSMTIDRLQPNTTYSWKLSIDWKDAGIDKEGTKVSLPRKFTTFRDVYDAPTIEQFNITTINRTSVQVDWAITDPNSSIENIKIVDESNNTIVDLGTKLEGSKTIDRLDPETSYSWKLVANYKDDWYDVEDSIESELFSFITSRDVYDAPTIEEFNVESKNKGFATINWKINDPNNLVTNIIVVDESDNEIVKLGNVASGTVEIEHSTLEPLSEHHWKLVVEWDDELYNGESYVESELISFTASDKTIDDNDNNFWIIFTIVIILFVIIIGGGILIAMPKNA